MLSGSDGSLGRDDVLENFLSLFLVKNRGALHGAAASSGGSQPHAAKFGSGGVCPLNGSGASVAVGAESLDVDGLGSERRFCNRFSKVSSSNTSGSSLGVVG